METRFCVTKKVTKTDPKRLGGGGDKRGIVGCSPLGLHHLSVNAKAWVASRRRVQSKRGLHPTARSAFLPDARQSRAARRLNEAVKVLKRSVP
jgi:hypothetical protein